jgi:FlaA1/EpsC-like NDP-sugar epimerase
VVGFIDDNPRKYRKRVMGYPVLGRREDLEKIIKKNNIQQIIISFRERGIERRNEIDALCLKIGADVEVRQMELLIS